MERIVCLPTASGEMVGIKNPVLEAFALEDIPEVLVGIDLEFATRRFIAGDNRVIVEVERRDCPHLVDSAFHAFL